jgi:hypothetical protein
LVSGSSNACEEATAGTELVDFLEALPTGRNEDKTAVTVIGSCCCLPPSLLEVDVETLVFPWLAGTPVEEFLLWLADEILELSVDVSAEVD